MTSAVRQRRPALAAVPETQHAFATSLEEELASVLRESGLRGRQARAVARRLGWSGHGATTLAEAAAEEGYTRERVRQLEDRLRRHAEGTPLSLPLTAAALAAGRERGAGLVQPGAQGHRPRRPVGRPVRPVRGAVGGRARPARHPGLRAGRSRAARGRGRIRRGRRLGREQARQAERSRNGRRTRRPFPRRGNLGLGAPGSRRPGRRDLARRSPRVVPRQGRPDAGRERAAQDALGLVLVEPGGRRRGAAPLVPAGQASAGRAAAGL